MHVCRSGAQPFSCGWASQLVPPAESAEPPEAMQWAAVSRTVGEIMVPEHQRSKRLPVETSVDL